MGVGLMSGEKPQHVMMIKKSSLLLLEGHLRLLFTTILVPPNTSGGTDEATGQSLDCLQASRFLGVSKKALESRQEVRDWNSSTHFSGGYGERL